MTYEEIVSGLRSLKAEEFDWSDPRASGDTRLRRLTGALKEVPAPERAVSELFAVMERLPEADLGSPGPLVHTLECMDYREQLVASVRRRPTILSVWMVNRVLNTALPPERRQFFLELLASVASNPAANESTRRDAKHFLEHQTDRNA